MQKVTIIVNAFIRDLIRKKLLIKKRGGSTDLDFRRIK